jgi:haloalkane dehalogenase
VFAAHATEPVPRLDRPDYPFASRLAELAAGRMHYLDEGPANEAARARGTLLFVHGTPTWSYEWRHLIRALSPDVRCVALDHLGFGLSERPRNFPYTPEAHARNLLEFARALDLRNVTLVVHDYGGPIGLPLCLEEPDRVQRLVLTNTWMWSFEDDRDMINKARIAGGVLGRLLYRHANMSLKILMPSAYGNRRKLTAPIHRQYLDRFPDAWSREAVLWALARAILGSSSFYRSLWERRSRLRGRPALLAWGMKDIAFGPRYLERWREVLPEAQVMELAGSGHWPHEEEPDRMIARLREFIAR